MRCARDDHPSTPALAKIPICKGHCSKAINADNVSIVHNGAKLELATAAVARAIRFGIDDLDCFGGEQLLHGSVSFRWALCPLLMFRI